MCPLRPTVRSKWAFMHSFPRLLTGPTALTLLLALTAAATAQPQVRPDILTLSAGGAGSLTALREANALIDRLSRDGTLRLSTQNSDQLVPDRTHGRYQQFHEGVPIFGAEVTRQTSRGLAVSVFGTIHLGVNIDTTPGLSPFEAASIIEGLSGTATPRAAQPRLVVLPDRTLTGIYRLAYEARAFTGTRLMVYFIDATTGALVWSYNDLKTQQPTLPCTQCAIIEGLGVKGDRKKMSVTTVGGTFLAHDRTRPSDVYTFDMDGDPMRALDVLTGASQLFDADLAMNPDELWLDGASADAHVGMGWTYDYLFHRFGRTGLNDENVRIVGLVHPIDRAAASTAPLELVNLFHLNAFYCGLCGPDGVGVAVFGEGLPQNLLLNGQRVNYFSGGLDIVAHELAHAVTDFTSALLYVDESGALNEAFSDLIGVGAEFYAETLFRDGAGVADYLLGEDVFEPGGIRSLADPQQFEDPDHYSLRFLGDADNGGVHTNSLIPGHAYYLAIEGGTNRVSGLRVIGVGAGNREQIEQVFYRAFTVLMTRSSDFATARAATIQSARDLYGIGGTVETAVTEAWTAVGVN